MGGLRVRCVLDNDSINMDAERDQETANSEEEQALTVCWFSKRGVRDTYCFQISGLHLRYLAEARSGILPLGP